MSESVKVAAADTPLSDLAPDVFSAQCESRGVLEHVVSRWGVLVLAALLDQGTQRFSALRRRIGGVSEKMLAQTLQTLERDGMLVREAKPVVPPHVEYTLTPLGEQAARQVWALARWTGEHLPEVLAARAAYDTRRNGTA
ncbi:winged helix-turn-helix transcriptional regulator [Streptomyces alkaliterrae]|uniref:Transcriptional regulator n=1 Tax=Streptomyces alkaliterrae TaxID=2213162 RepID=A0A5P0YV27_9ACTN|nr:helix-turn-helix domain-containing protein [Streptomyces alkaliterrae]MBB1252866.1 helix-turn-helix transcriptional regulator [Streptomyces alkaliterrae]MBB1258806.1 helix-turn-helix transcriptional regulator [Streptomyces alkaliterrae]MQS03810.1 transcriptional regulator [Streptomyces alkaliterrae]